MFGDERASAGAGNAFKGTLTSIEQTEKTLSVKSFWRTRTFDAADNCKVSLEDKPQAALTDLRPGQRVEVRYETVSGVRIAHQINQENLVFQGRVTSLDPANRKLTVRHRGLSTEFAMARDCPVLKEGSNASLDDLKIGHLVHVVYLPEPNTRTALRIEQRNAEFVGTIRAIDAGTRTVKAKSLLGERKFHLARECQIVTSDKPDATLQDLRIGDRVTFTYEETDGVYVVNRIGREGSTSEPPTLQTAESSRMTP